MAQVPPHNGVKFYVMEKLFFFKKRLIWTTKPKLDQVGNYFFHEYISFSELLVGSQEDEIVKYKYILSLESGINVPLHLLIFGIFSRGYSLITDLKDYISLQILMSYVYSFCQIFQKLFILRLFRTLEYCIVVLQVLMCITNSKIYFLTKGHST